MDYEVSKSKCAGVMPSPDKHLLICQQGFSGMARAALCQQRGWESRSGEDTDPVLQELAGSWEGSVYLQE